ncbi:MAG: S8 family serine peptidase [Planctomycetes bacterium]|nr:S8 family serine peptidase [Planctomycetota bacterium]
MTRRTCARPSLALAFTASASLVAAAAAPQEGAPERAAPQRPRHQDGHAPLVGEFVPHELLYRIAGEPTVERRAAIRALAGALEGARGEEELWRGTLFRLRLAPERDLAAALCALNDSPLVRYAEPNFVARATGVPNDPLVPLQWHLGQANDSDMDLFEAWDVARGDAGVVLATVDTGFDHAHPDLAHKAWVNPGEIAGNGIDDDANGWIDDVHGIDPVNGDGDPMDDNGHGTFVAGIAAAEPDNGQGIAGVAWNARIMGCKFLAASGSGSFAEAITSLDYAVANGAAVSNHSYNSPSFSQTLYDAFDLAGDAGHLAIVPGANSANNLDVQPSYPVCFDLPEILAIGSTDENDALTGFSDYGKASLDVLVPGNNLQSTTLGGGYAAGSANSYAAPTATGLAALLAWVGGSRDGQQIKDWIQDSVDPLAPLSSKCATGGRINAWKAVQRAAWSSLASERWNKPGTRGSSAAGSALCVAADADGDGRDDVAIGVPGDRPGSFTGGSVQVVSGLTGATLRTIAGPNQNGARFGAALAALRDVDGDGIDDLAVGQPEMNAGFADNGGVRIVSGATGATIATLDGAAATARDGSALAAAGDLDGDGSGDCFIGGPGRSHVAARRAIDGALLWDEVRPAVDEFGASLANVGDQDGDGRDDVLVGAPGLATAELLSGADGSTLLTLNYATVDRVGATVANVGDVDRDGFDDFGIGNDARNRVVRIVSGATGALLYRRNVPAGATGEIAAFARAEDRDGDRVPDYWIAWRGLDVAELRSGVDGALLQAVEGASGNAFGAALLGDVDLDGDGAFDLIVAAPDEDVAGVGLAAGRTRAYSSAPLRFTALPGDPDEGDLVTATIAGGATGMPFLLVLVDVDGIPLFEVLFLDLLDQYGGYEIADTIPSGASGSTFTLQVWSLKYARPRLVASNRAPIAVQ